MRLPKADVASLLEVNQTFFKSDVAVAGYLTKTTTNGE